MFFTISGGGGGSLIGMAFEMDGAFQVFLCLAEASFIGLIYSIIGWDDIKRKIKQ